MSYEKRLKRVDKLYTENGKNVPIAFNDTRFNFMDYIGDIIDKINELVECTNNVYEIMSDIYCWIDKEFEKHISEKLKDYLTDEKLIELIGKLMTKELNDDYESVISKDIQNYDYTTFLSDLNKLECKYKGKLSVLTIGKSYLGRDIKAVLIGNINAEYKSQIISNEHAKEILNAQLCLRQAEFICENWNNIQRYTNRTVGEIFNDSCMLFIPMQNPDGVELVQHGFQSIPQSTPDRANLIKNIKVAMEKYVQEGFQKYASFRDDWEWWDRTEDMDDYGGLVMCKCTTYVFDEKDLYVWNSNLQGIDLYLNKWTDKTIRNYTFSEAHPRGYTQGKFRLAFDVGVSGWNAVENATIKDFLYSNGFMKYVIDYHNAGPHVAFNFILGNRLNRGYEITRKIAYDTKTVINYSVFNQISMPGCVYTEQSGTAYCCVIETGFITWEPHGNLSREYDRAISTAHFSPLPSVQEPYIFSQYKTFLIMFQEQYVREMDFVYKNDILTKTETDYGEFPMPILTVSTSSGSLDLNQKAELNASSRISIHKIGKLIIVNGHVNVNGVGTIGTQYDNYLTVYHNELPKAKDGSIPRWFGIVGNTAKVGELRKNTNSHIVKGKNFITFKTHDETGAKFLSAKDLQAGTTIGFNIMYHAE